MVRKTYKKTVDLSPCVCVPTGVIRHSSLVAVPLFLKNNVAKLKHSRHHFQHGCREQREGVTLTHSIVIQELKRMTS